MLALPVSMLLSRASTPKSSRLGLGLGQHLIGFFPLVEHNQSSVDGFAEAGFERLVDFLLRRLDFAGGNFSQRENRHDDIAFVLIGLDAPLFFQRLQPLIDRNGKLGGHPFDFVVDILLRDFNAQLIAAPDESAIC